MRVKLLYASLIDRRMQVLEYMGGGDLLNLLIERDVFDEDFTRFYIAEVRHFPRKTKLTKHDTTPDDFSH
jgi:hypothetical protein